MSKQQKVRFYAELKGRVFELRQLRKFEDACKRCAIKSKKCGCEKQKVVPCDDIYFDLDEIHDGNYKIVDLRDSSVRRLRKIVNAAFVSRGLFYGKGEKR